MTTKFKLVKVSDQGVQFGNAWYSHESITGYSADQLNQGTCCVTGGAYMKWLSEPTPPQPIFDEAKERELFGESATSALGRDSDGYYIATDTYLRWQGWIACAQSRAKAGEADNE